jgi:hypothetical protein
LVLYADIDSAYHSLIEIIEQFIHI